MSQTGYFLIKKNNDDSVITSINFISESNTKESIKDYNLTQYKDLCKYYDFYLPNTFIGYTKEKYKYCYSTINAHNIELYFSEICDNSTYSKKKLYAVKKYTEKADDETGKEITFEYYYTSKVKYSINNKKVLEKNKEEYKKLENDKKEYEEKLENDKKEYEKNQQKLKDLGLISGGKKNRKSRRKSKRSKKTAKRVR
jgi:hypothetical protein